MNYSRKTIFLLILFLLSTASAQDKVSRIENFISKQAAYGMIHGSVLVAEQGKIIYQKAFGLASIEDSVANTVETPYRIYSMSKQFTALLVLQLAEAGKIDLQKTISDYLPYYREDVGRKVTVHQLLTHTHGITEGYNRLPARPIEEQTQQLIEKYFSNEPSFEPGSNFRYSGLLGYTILAAIIESVSGKKYRDVLQENIFDPLGMRHSYYLDYKHKIPGRASDYRRNGADVQVRLQAYPVNACGASGIVTTVKDLLLWDQALYGEKLLSKPYRDLLFTTHVTQYKPRYYGYGWHLQDMESGSGNRRIHFHPGGGSTIIIRSVSDGQTIILLNNVRAGGLYETGMELLNLLQEKQ